MSLRFKFILDRYIGGAMIFVLNIIAHLVGWTLRRDHTLRVKGDILIIKMLGGGGMVTAMPALYGIRKAYPGVKLRLLTTMAVKPFAETLGIFDEILVLNDHSLSGLIVSGVRHMWTCIGSDTVIDLEIYSFLTTVFSLFTFARLRLGFFYEETGFRQCLHTHRLFFHAASPLYKHYDSLARLLGAAVVTSGDCAAQLRASLGIAAMAVDRTPRIAIGSGCSDLFSVRKLTPQQWSRDVFMREPDRRIPVVFLGAAADRAEADAIIAAIKAASRDDGDAGWQGAITNACGAQSLADSLRTLAACTDYWGIDSSLLHYARLFGLRCKIFLGPTHPRLLRPIAGLDEKVYYRKTLCSPCVHLTSVPPCRGDNLCMTWLFEQPLADDPREGWLPMVTD